MEGEKNKTNIISHDMSLDIKGGRQEIKMGNNPNNYPKKHSSSHSTPINNEFLNSMFEVENNHSKSKTKTRLRKDASSIYKYFSEYEEQKIDEALEKLPKEELDLLHKRYGKDLKYPVINRDIGLKDVSRINATVFKHIRKFIEGTSGKMYITNIYEYFREYGEQEIDEAIKKLPKDDLDLLHKRYGKDLKEPVINRNMSREDINKISTTVIKHIRKLLEKETIKTYNSKNNIYKYFSEYEEQEIDEAIKRLPKEELDLLHKRYGKDLKEPVINRDIDPKDLRKITITIFIHIRRLILGIPINKRKKESVDDQQIIEESSITDKSNQEDRNNQIQQLTSMIESGNLELKEFSEEDYLTILELFHHPIFEDIAKENMSIDMLMIFALKIGFYQRKFFTTDSISKFFGVSFSFVLDIQKRGLEIFEDKLNQMIDGEIKEELKNISSTPKQMIRSIYEKR